MEPKLEAIRKSIQERPGWRWFLLFTVLLGATMSALDVSIVNVAMPTLKNTFGVSMAVIEWVAMAYMLTLTIFLPLFGRLADMLGRSKLYNIGFVVFSAGSLLCGMSPAAGFMIAARIIQAVGAGLLQANSVALIMHAFPPGERGKAIGIQAAVQAIAMSAGPFVGGILIATIGWRAIFYVNIPIGVLGTVAALFILPRDRRSDKKERVDYLGAVLFASGLACIVLAFNGGVKLESGSSTTIVFFIHACILLGLFILTELRVENPLIDLKLFQNRTFLIGNLTGMLSYFVLFAVMFLMPFYLEKALGYSVALTGSLLTPLLLAMAVVAPFSGHISDKYGPRIITTSGMLLSALACFSLMLMGVSVRLPLLAMVLILLGVGMGMFITPNNSAVIGSAPQEKLGVAGGVLNMMRSLGLIFGVNISGLIFTTLERRYLSDNGYPNIQSISGNTSIPLPVKAGAFMHGFMMVIMVLMAVTMLSAFLSSVRKVKAVAIIDHEAAETALVSSGFFNGFSRESRGMALFIMLLLFAGITGAFASSRLTSGSFPGPKIVQVLPAGPGRYSDGQGQRGGMRDRAFDLSTMPIKKILQVPKIQQEVI
jgi:EmrB/QacA subfamily drug resistance transporter